MECPNCNKPNPGGVVYCKECGTPLLIAPDNPAGIEWVEISAGEFLCSDDVTYGVATVLQRTFKIGKYPVTNAQYKLFLGSSHPERLGSSKKGLSTKQGKSPCSICKLQRCICLLQVGRLQAADKKYVGKSCPRHSRENISLGRGLAG